MKKDWSKFKPAEKLSTSDKQENASSILLLFVFSIQMQKWPHSVLSLYVRLRIIDDHFP